MGEYPSLRAGMDEKSRLGFHAEAAFFVGVGFSQEVRPSTWKLRRFNARPRLSQTIEEAQASRKPA